MPGGGGGKPKLETTVARHSLPLTIRDSGTECRWLSVSVLIDEDYTTLDSHPVVPVLGCQSSAATLGMTLNCCSDLILSSNNGNVEHLNDFE